LTHKGYKCLEVSSGWVYASRDIIFDEGVFSFMELHSNVGARLRDEINLLPGHLVPSKSQVGGSMSLEMLSLMKESFPSWNSTQMHGLTLEMK
jgi:hypothetical protein